MYCDRWGSAPKEGGDLSDGVATYFQFKFQIGGIKIGSDSEEETQEEETADTGEPMEEGEAGEEDDEGGLVTKQKEAIMKHFSYVLRFVFLFYLL